MQKVHSFSESLDSAKEILSQNGNRLVLVCSFLVLLTTALFYRLLYLAFAVWLSLPFARGGPISLFLMGTYGLLLLVFTLLVVLPFCQGVLMMAGEMVSGKTVTIAAIFEPFCEKKTYFHCVQLAIGLVWRCVCVGVLAFVGVDFLIPATVDLFWRNVILVLAIFFIGILVIGSRFSLFYFTRGGERMPRRTAQRQSLDFFRIHPLSTLRYFVRFLPHILLGILTIGIYLLAQVLPLMVLTYFCECKKTHELMIHLEENKDHE